jgi:peptide/nickel transport system permease protein
MLGGVIKKGGYWYYVIQSLKKQKAALFGAGLIIFIFSLAVLAPYISPHSPKKQYWGSEYESPSSRFLLGTDELGRDVLSRLIWGSRTSLSVGIFSTIIMVAVAIVLGSISGYFGGRIDKIIIGFTDIFMTIPSIILFIFITAIFTKPTILLMVVILGFLGWPVTTRIIRSSFLSLKELPFVEAAKNLGNKDRSIIFKHILPNTLSPIIVTATLQIPTAIIMEAAISFLALGDPTIISWGGMLTKGHEILRVAPWVATYPGLMIFLTVMGFNLFGDGLRDALDVRLREL